jgi:hypothetical protein
VNRYFRELQTFGSTGSPEVLTGLGSQSEHTLIPDPEGRHLVEARSIEQARRLENYLQRASGNELVVVLELFQDPTGRVVKAELVEASGDKLFDEHILDITRAGDFPGVPKHVVARSRGAVHSTWEFRGRYNFRKKLRELRAENPADAALIALEGLGSLLTGLPFDETTGDIYVLDFRDPRFDVRSKLLRLY